MNKYLSSFLVLDYNKPDETKLCLESIRQHAKFPHQIIYLDNGSRNYDEYPNELYASGLIDVMIRRAKGFGGGYGQTDLFRFCDTDTAFFVQNDQYLLYDINEDILNKFKELISSGGYHCVDLNGDQSNRGVWTDRAHFISVPFFNSLGPFPNGGPGGGRHHIPWNEKYLQDIFEQRGYKIAHIKPVLFADNGKTSVRNNPDGSVWMHYTDTKQLWLISGPVKEKYVYPNLTDEEWNDVLRTQSWEPGKIPEKDKQHSFHFWH